MLRPLYNVPVVAATPVLWSAGTTLRGARYGCHGSYTVPDKAATGHAKRTACSPCGAAQSAERRESQRSLRRHARGGSCTPAREQARARMHAHTRTHIPHAHACTRTHAHAHARKCMLASTCARTHARSIKPTALHRRTARTHHRTQQPQRTSARSNAQNNARAHSCTPARRHACALTRCMGDEEPLQCARRPITRGAPLPPPGAWHAAWHCSLSARDTRSAARPRRRRRTPSAAESTRAHKGSRSHSLAPTLTRASAHQSVGAEAL